MIESLKQIVLLKENILYFSIVIFLYFTVTFIEAAEVKEFSVRNPLSSIHLSPGEEKTDSTGEPAVSLSAINWHTLDLSKELKEAAEGFDEADLGEKPKLTRFQKIAALVIPALVMYTAVAVGNLVANQMATAIPPTISMQTLNTLDNITSALEYQMSIWISYEILRKAGSIGVQWARNLEKAVHKLSSSKPLSFKRNKNSCFNRQTCSRFGTELFSWGAGFAQALVPTSILYQYMARSPVTASWRYYRELPFMVAYYTLVGQRTFKEMVETKFQSRDPAVKAKRQAVKQRFANSRQFVASMKEDRPKIRETLSKLRSAGVPAQGIDPKNPEHRKTRALAKATFLLKLSEGYTPHPVSLAQKRTTIGLAAATAVPGLAVGGILGAQGFLRFYDWITTGGVYQGSSSNLFLGNTTSNVTTYLNESIYYWEEVQYPDGSLYWLYHNLLGFWDSGIEPPYPISAWWYFNETTGDWDYTNNTIPDGLFCGATTPTNQTVWVDDICNNTTALVNATTPTTTLPVSWIADFPNLSVGERIAACTGGVVGGTLSGVLAAYLAHKFYQDFQNVYTSNPAYPSAYTAYPKIMMSLFALGGLEAILWASAPTLSAYSNLHWQMADGALYYLIAAYAYSQWTAVTDNFFNVFSNIPYDVTDLWDALKKGWYKLRGKPKPTERVLSAARVQDLLIASINKAEKVFDGLPSSTQVAFHDHAFQTPAVTESSTPALTVRRLAARSTLVPAQPAVLSSASALARTEDDANKTISLVPVMARRDRIGHRLTEHESKTVSLNDGPTTIELVTAVSPLSSVLPTMGGTALSAADGGAGGTLVNVSATQKVIANEEAINETVPSIWQMLTLSVGRAFNDCFRPRRHRMG